MNYSGLTWHYPLNRPLTKQETEYHLLPKQPSAAPKPHYQLSVIKMNSTYLECVDKYYGWVGFMTAFVVASIALVLCMMVGMFSIVIQKWSFMPEQEKLEASMTLIVLCVIGAPVFLLGVWNLSKEIFRYTHYPMRFNRKTRMVHVFRLDGTVMSESWDKLYFTVSPGQKGWWDIHGHRLADDGVTVLETFALSEYDATLTPHLFMQWEFIRQYMEDGPKNLIDQVEFTMNISDKRETYWFGFQRLMADFGQYTLFAWLCLPFILPSSLGRWIAMQTSKIPVWPAEIEAECQVDPDDPFQRDEQHPHPAAQ
jgi:hypothetical protein